MLLRPLRLRLTGLALLAPVAPHVAPAETPATIFENQCASCHGLDGKARTPAGKKARAKDLAESKLDDAEIVRQIREGSKDKQRAVKMPAFADKLSADEITALVDYVKRFRPQ